MLIKFRIELVENFEKNEWVNVHGEGTFEIMTKLKDVEFKKDRQGILVRRRLPEDPEE